MAPRDFYEILGVSRTAETGAIKKAYRVLALKYHPDRNPGDSAAEEKFKEATEAYEVLSHQEKRGLYDRFGHAGLKGGPAAGGFGGGFEFDLHDALRAFMRDFGDAFGMGGMGTRTQDRGSDLRVSLQVSLQDMLTGVEKTLKIRRQVPCQACRGTGGEGGRAPETCGLCQGSGQVRRVERSFFGQFVNVGRCPQCGGRGRVVEDACSVCRGAGTVRGEATVEVEVPAGADSGDYLSLRGEGDAAPQGGEPGDLQVVIDVGPLPGFERHGRDLLTEVALSPARAALGGKMTVPTLEGTATLSVPAGVQHGTLLRLKGKGLPPLRGGSRGNQFVRANVVVPEKLDKKRRKLYQELLDLDGGEEA